MQAEIEGFLAGILGSTPPITHRWAGILGLTPDHLPLVGDLPARPGIWTSLGYSGTATFWPSSAGAVAAALLQRDDPRFEPLSPGRFRELRPRG